MRAVIGHHHWARPGGGQLVVAAAAHALSKHREVTLAGIAKFDPSKYLEWFGIDLRNLPIVSLPFALSAFGLYSRLLIWYPTEKAIGRETDLVFLDEYNYGPLLRKKKKNKFKLVEYIHFPIERSVGLNRESDPYVVERYSHFPLNMYWETYLKLLKVVVRKNPFQTADVVLTNSKWTAGVVKETYGEIPVVLNPPIPPNVEPSGQISQFDERVNNVVMVGRFTEEKRYKWVIENIAPKLVGSSKLFVFGGAGTPISLHYKNRLMSLAARLGLKVSDRIDNSGDIYFISDAPRYLINSTIDKSKVFLHSTINEHWGIVVAEAMARGLPIIVHKSGGAWCFTEGTEILTCRGWKDLKDISLEDLVATRDTDGAISYQMPTGIVKENYSGDVIKIKNDSIEIEATPEHRLLLKQNSDKEYHFMQMKEMKKSRYRIPRTGIWTGHNPSTMALDKGNTAYIDWIKFLAIWLAEGWIDYRSGSEGDKYHKEGTPFRVCIAQKNRISFVREVAAKLPYAVRESQRENGCVSFRIGSSYLAKLLHSYGMGKAGTKFVPQEVKDSTASMIRAFLDAYNKCDGWISKKGLVNYVTTSERMANDLQELVFKSGGLSTIRKIQVKGFHHHTNYIVSERKRKVGHVRQRDISRIKYQGKIYCVSVPNRVIYVRKNGKPMWSGNSDLAEEGSSGIGYESAKETIESIILLCTDRNKWSYFQKKGLERTRELSLENFSARLNQLAK